MILDGKIIAQDIYKNLKQEIQKLDHKPVLWAVLVGNNDASMRYINQKRKFAEQIGMWFTLFEYPDTITEKELIKELIKLNSDHAISWYIVQLPLPDHINSWEIINSLSPLKDVDGFHPENQGKIMIWDTSGFAPCTPAGIMKIFEYYNISLKGKSVCILGRSNIVGKPLAMMCINAGATVTSCNSSTKDITVFTQTADIVICATWQAHMLRKDMVWAQGVIIDVGFSVIDEKIYGDAHTLELEKNGNFITPVPGWVGPMTVAMLLSNTYIAHMNHHE